MLLRNRPVPLALFALSFAVAMRAQDRANCSNATLHGGYGLHATGTIIGVGDFAAVDSKLE